MAISSQVIPMKPTANEAMLPCTDRAPPGATKIWPATSQFKVWAGFPTVELVAKLKTGETATGVPLKVAVEYADATDAAELPVSKLFRIERAVVPTGAVV